MTFSPNPLSNHVLSLLEHDRAAVERLSVELCTELLPTVMRADSPGWQGLARRSFDMRCERMAADVRRVSTSLDDISATLAGAIATVGVIP